jgi:predicted GNAT superfamily acetyltransferase
MPEWLIRDLTTAADLDACVALQEAVWGAGFSERVPAALLRVSLRVGAVLGGAFDADGRLIGHVFGLTGVRGGQIIHWSDMLAVHPDARDRGIGEALKRYQRDTLLARGVKTAEWTFDPLEARNAHLNFARFGTVACEYIRDFYASSDSPMHSGIPTDRLIVTWELDSAHVAGRLEGRAPAPRLDRALLLNEVRQNHGLARSASPRLDAGAPQLLLAVPSDIQSIKLAAPEAAIEWRAFTRAAFEHYLGRGYCVTDFLRGNDYGTYLLENAAADSAVSGFVPEPGR